MVQILFPLAFGLINLYLFRTASAAYPQFTLFWATALSLLFGSLFLAVQLERGGKLKASLPFSWIGYTWLGVAGIAATLAALSDLAQWLLPGLTDRAQFLGIAAATLLLSLWAALSAQRLTLKRVRLASPLLSAAGQSFTVAQISDLHLGESSSLRHVKRLVETLNAQRPDLVVSTGDLFDGYLELMAPYVDCLRQLEAPLGKFAVCGNHEVYAGLDEALSLTQLAGFTLLRNESRILADALQIAGVEDSVSPLGPDEAAALAACSPERFTLLLKHRPTVNPKSSFTLQLSGHTHGGQIAPFHLIAKLLYPAKVGLSKVAPGQFLYLSRGAGAWGPQLRLFAPSEVTVFELSAG